MTETNNRSVYSLDNKRQAKPLELSGQRYSQLSLARLSCLERKLSRIKKIKPQNVILHQAWMIKIL